MTSTTDNRPDVGDKTPQDGDWVGLLEGCTDVSELPDTVARILAGFEESGELDVPSDDAMTVGPGIRSLDRALKRALASGPLQRSVLRALWEAGGNGTGIRAFDDEVFDQDVRHWALCRISKRWPAFATDTVGLCRTRDGRWEHHLQVAACDRVKAAIWESLGYSFSADLVVVPSFLVRGPAFVDAVVLDEDLGTRETTIRLARDGGTSLEQCREIARALSC